MHEDHIRLLVTVYGKLSGLFSFNGRWHGIRCDGEIVKILQVRIVKVKILHVRIVNTKISLFPIKCMHVHSFTFNYIYLFALWQYMALWQYLSLHVRVVNIREARLPLRSGRVWNCGHSCLLFVNACIERDKFQIHIQIHSRNTWRHRISHKQ